MPGPSQQRELPDLAPLINQALLDPHLDQEVLQQTCDAARHFGFAGVCTNLNRLQAARERLGPPGPTRLIAVIAFSLRCHTKHAQTSRSGMGRRSWS